MRVTLRLLANVIILALALGGIARWMWSLHLERRASVDSFPDRVGPWSLAREDRLDADVLSVIQPDAYFMRRYDAPERSPIWIYLGFYARRAGYGAGAHDPEACYPAQGWEILTAQSTELPLGATETLHAKVLEAHKGLSEEVVLYWFQPAGRWPARPAFEELLRIVDAAAGRPQYAFVRLSVRGDSGEALADLRAFAGTLAPAARHAVENALRSDAPASRQAMSRTSEGTIR